MSITRNKFSAEVRDRAVRMVDEYRADYGSEWAAMTSIAGKIGCTAETAAQGPPLYWLSEGETLAERRINSKMPNLMSNNNPRGISSAW